MPYIKTVVVLKWFEPEKEITQPEIIQELFYSDDTELPIIFSNRSRVQGMGRVLG
jgi:hypothetical protein